MPESLPHVRAVGECKVIGTHEEALYLEDLRRVYCDNRDPAILAEVVEEHGITAVEWEQSCPAASREEQRICHPDYCGKGADCCQTLGGVVAPRESQRSSKEG